MLLRAATVQPPPYCWALRLVSARLLGRGCFWWGRCCEASLTHAVEDAALVSMGTHRGHGRIRIPADPHPASLRGTVLFQLTGGVGPSHRLDLLFLGDSGS